MTPHDDIDLNGLTGKFFALAEEWEEDARSFSWDGLHLLARTGANAYNAGRGPSFHALALDGVVHNEFHLRFLRFSLQAGFDPFKLTVPGSSGAPCPVISHETLAEAALDNSWSARMRDLLVDEARKRFCRAILSDEAAARISEDDAVTIATCAPSMPVELLEKISADKVSARRARPDFRQVNAVEAYLSAAEVFVENGGSPG